METEQRIKKTLADISHLKMTKNHLEKLGERMKEATLELEDLSRRMDKEYDDIVQLEKLTIRHLFAKILGDNEKQMEIERQEYLQAVLNYKDVKKRLSLMDFEQKLLKEKVVQLPNLESELKRLFEIRENEMMRFSGERQYEIRYIKNKIDNTFRLKMEIYEAKIVGAKIKVMLEEMIQHLMKARDSDIWNNRLSTIEKLTLSVPKHLEVSGSYVQKALEIFYKVNLLIEEFEDELKNVYKNHNIKFIQYFDELYSFSRMYHANLISDWVGYKEIHSTLFNIENLHTKILKTLASLDLEDKNADKKTIALEEKIKQMIKESIK